MPKKAKPNPTDLFELGQFYLLNQKYSYAIKQFKEALKLKPDDAQTYFHLGLAYEASNQITEAQEMFRKALQLDKNLKAAEEHLTKLTGNSKATL